MRLHKLAGAACVLSASVLVGNVQVGAAPAIAFHVNAVRVDAVWDPGDGGPVLAVQAYSGTFDIGSGPQPLSWSHVALPTEDGGQASCWAGGTADFGALLPDGALDIDANLRAAALAASYSCSDGRTLSVELEWTASGPPKGTGTGVHRELAAVGAFGAVTNSSGAATGTITDGTTNFAAHPSTQATIARERTNQLCGMGSIVCP